MALQISKRLISVEEYHIMAEVGILKKNDRIELIEGEIIKMSPIGSKHSSHVKRINKLLGRLLPDYIILGVQDPVKLNDFSEPEPDISILRPSEDFYYEKHPTPEDVILIIEVADSSLEYDHQVKLPNYASAGIPEYWIVDLEKSVIEVFTFPKHGAYSSREIKYREDSIYLKEFDLEVKVEEILH